MLIKELKEHYGSWTKLMRKLDMGTATYQGWLRKGFIPFPTQCLIEKKTGGLFVAEEAHGEQKPD